MKAKIESKFHKKKVPEEQIPIVVKTGIKVRHVMKITYYEQ